MAIRKDLGLIVQPNQVFSFLIQFRFILFCLHIREASIDRNQPILKGLSME